MLSGVGASRDSHGNTLELLRGCLATYAPRDTIVHLARGGEVLRPSQLIKLGRRVHSPNGSLGEETYRTHLTPLTLPYTSTQSIQPNPAQPSSAQPSRTHHNPPSSLLRCRCCLTPCFRLFYVCVMLPSNETCTCSRRLLAARGRKSRAVQTTTIGRRGGGSSRNGKSMTRYRPAQG